MKRGIIIVIVSAWLILTLAAGHADVNVYEPNDPRVGFIIVSWADRPASEWEASVQALYDTGVTDVTFVTYRFNEYDDATSTFGTNIAITNTHGYERSSDAAIEAAIQQAKSLGMTVTLNPFVEVDAIGGIGAVWRGNVNFPDNDDLAAWFGSYDSYMYDMATLADANGVDRLMIGSELQGLSLDGDATSHWNSLIGDIRAVYDGKLSYAANWNWEYNHVPFWSQLDEIGIEAYFELVSEGAASGAGNPSLETLVSGWESVLSSLESYSIAQSRPIIFSEVGYTYLDKTTAYPWNWYTSDDSDYQEQLNAYKAVIQSTDLQGDWLKDIAFWHWDMIGATGSNYIILSDSEPAEYVGGYVPEPATTSLIISGLGALLVGFRRRQRSPDGAG